MKEWFKSRTMWLGFGVGLLGLVQATLASAPLEAQTQGIILGVIGAAIGVLRKLTTTAIGSGE
jgi:hypothetical protein